MSDISTPRMRQTTGDMAGIGPGTPVMTPDGLIPAGLLAAGDRVVTHDTGTLRLDHVAVHHVPASAAVVVRPAVLDPADDTPDMVISAGQRLMLRGWRARAMFGTNRATVAAARIADGAYIARMKGPGPVRLIVPGFAGAEHVIQLGGGFEIVSALLVEAAD